MNSEMVSQMAKVSENGKTEIFMKVTMPMVSNRVKASSSVPSKAGSTKANGSEVK